MLCIVSGLVIVKTFASPLAAFICIRGDVKRMFFSVLIPAAIFTFCCYGLSSYLFKSYGIAIANIIVSTLWIILMLKEIKKYNYTFKGILNGKKDLISIIDYLKGKGRL